MFLVFSLDDLTAGVKTLLFLRHEDVGTAC